MESYIGMGFVIMLALFGQYVLEGWRKHYLDQIGPLILVLGLLRIHDIISSSTQMYPFIFNILQFLHNDGLQ